MLALTCPLAGQTFNSHGYGTYQTGLVPEDLVVADLDGNGSPDAAVANTNASETGTADTVSVYLNQGNGTFGLRADYAVGDRPEGIAAGDFDGDALVDLATANYNGNSVTVLSGTGNGTFSAGGSIAVSGGPRGITSDDFDGDGKTDLATANYTGSSVSILKGAGDGTFTVLGTTSVGRSPEVVAKGFVNADSVVDLVTCDAADDRVTVLLGNGNGTFTLLAAVAAGDNPRHVKLVDLNEDGFDDILTANFNSSTVTVLKNNSGASFTPQGTLSIAGVSGCVYLNVADLNADGRLDCLVSFAQSDTIGVFPGTGAFTFGAGELIPAGDNPLGIGIADLDSSGRPDLVLANALDDNLFVLLSTLSSNAIVLDNGQPGTSSTGTWSTSGAPGPFGTSSLFAKAAAGTVYTWNVPLPFTGTYSTYAWWTQSTNRVTSAPYTVTHSGGQTTIQVDQTRNGGRWNFLGTFSFGSTGAVRVSSTSSSLSTSADTVCFQPLPQGNAPPTAFVDSISPGPASFGSPVTFTGTGFDPDGSAAGYRWRSSLDGALSSAASFTTSTLSTGTHEISFRVQDNQGLWSTEIRATLVVEASGPTHTAVMDNGDPGTTFTGTWSVSGAPNPFGPNSLYAKNGATYTYTFTLASAGTYDVFAWWTQLSSRPSSAPIDITHSGGTSTVNVNQQANGGQWNLLGRFSFGATAIVKVSAIGSASTCADAICLSLAGGANSPPAAQITSIAPSPSAQGQSVAFAGSGTDSDGTITGYNWRSSVDGQLSTLASFSTTSLSAGAHTIFFKVQDDGGVWSTEVEQTLQVNGAASTLILDNGDPGTSSTGAWTVSGAPNPYGPNSLYAKNGATYAYTFSVTSPGAYTVNAWWTQLSSRPSSAPIEIQHSGGTATVNVDQRSNGGQWNALGTFTFGSTAVVKITAVGTGSTCADAISLVAAAPGDIIADNGGPGTSFTGTWSISGAPSPYGPTSLYAKNGPTYTYTIPASGTFKVHAWWTQLSSRPSSAPIEIQHSGGTTTVNVNQQANGGQWNLLGTFTFGSTAVVKITAVGTASTCADALRLEPVP